MKHKIPFYFIFMLPLIFAFLAIAGLGFAFKAGVTLSCLLIIGFAYNTLLFKLIDVWWIILAFVFSIIGDGFLSNKGDSFLIFAAGIGFYFLAHMGYLIYAMKNGVFNVVFTIMITLVYLIFFVLVLSPAIGEPILQVAVLIYLLVSCLSFGASIGLHESKMIKWSYFLGISLIIFSDTIISFKEFTSYQKLNFLILPTYYLAQMIITFAVIKKGERDTSNSQQARVSNTARL